MSDAPWWLNCSQAEFDRKLEEARDQGDHSDVGPNADELVRRVFVQQVKDPNGFGRMGYHHLMILADKILLNSELLLIRKSDLNRQLAAMPEAIVDYFDPMPAPDWVDPEQLAIASGIWVNNTISLLLVLYAASLPSCYVIRRGIPVLYTSEKLRDRKNISQRLFETGFMLDDVMSPGGIRLIEDVGDVAGGGTAKRYLWGKGYLSAKKVRALHASMRLMLQYPPGSVTPDRVDDPVESWKNHWTDQGLGVPINQEDVAFTLLTFGYLLPRGLETWGCRLSLKERNAVLHLWKVTGYIMGLRPDLMTDRWDEAELLFAKLVARGGGSTPQGIALTNRVMDFVGGYFPKIGGLDKRLPASMIIDQCGMEIAGMVLEPERIRESLRWGPRLRYGLAKRVVRSYFFLRHLIIPRIPMVGAFLGNLLHGSGTELIESFRDSFVRQAFFIPKDATTWEENPAATAGFHERLDRWRQQLFRWIMVSVVMLITSLFSFTGLLVALPILLLDTASPMAVLATKVFSVGTLLFLLLGVVSMKWRLPAVFRSRPMIPGNGKNGSRLG